MDFCSNNNNNTKRELLPIFVLYCNTATSCNRDVSLRNHHVTKLCVTLVGGSRTRVNGGTAWNAESSSHSKEHSLAAAAAARVELWILDFLFSTYGRKKHLHSMLLSSEQRQLASLGVRVQFLFLYRKHFPLVAVWRTCWKRKIFLCWWNIFSRVLKQTRQTKTSVESYSTSSLHWFILVRVERKL